MSDDQGSEGGEVLDAPNQQAVGLDPPWVEGTGGEAGESAPATTGAFDPSEATVDEVKAHVGKHPDQLEQVLQAETAGKNRTTLVTWLEEQSG